MSIYVMSHAQLETYTRDEQAFDFIAIVVYSTNKDIPYIESNPHTKDVLFEQFDDDDESMTFEQAVEIAKFVQMFANDDVDIVVSCQYGESRSAGIACAIAAYLGQDEMDIWTNPNKTPNMHCYKLMCHALNIERSDEELRRLFLINAQNNSRSL